jgi:hypothetical protein
MAEYRIFDIKSGIALITDYVRMKPEKSNAKNNDECQRFFGESDFYLLNAYKNLKHLIDSNKVPRFGVQSFSAKVQKLKLKCCACPNEEGIMYDAKHRIRIKVNTYVLDWYASATQFKENGFTGLDKISRRQKKGNLKTKMRGV